MLTAIKLISTMVVFYIIMNRVLTRLDDGYWFRRPTRHKFTPTQSTKPQQDKKTTKTTEALKSTHTHK